MGMIVSHRWLEEWVEGLPEPTKVAHVLTMGGFEVDEITEVPALSPLVVVGKVVAAESHPNADRLNVCQVDVGEDALLNIVCGCPTVKAGLHVAVARIGAKLPGDFQIKAAKLRGVASEGMICAKRELGLASDEKGIWHLAGEWSIGQSLNQTVLQGDHLYHVDITPNRGDCLSHLGIARELALLLDLTCKDPQEVVSEVTSAGGMKARSIAIEAKDGCHQYVSAEIQGIDANAQTPMWMQERLQACGIAPLGLVVDVTHYVMLTLGQPMHAFDGKAVQGGITVRMAKQGEKLLGLDQQERTLSDDHLVIADEQNVLALAGMMGGELSGVQVGQTDHVVLESAAFSPSSVVRAVRDFHCHTDASDRFTRGVDPVMPSFAMDYALSLLLRYGGGQCVIKQVTQGGVIKVPTISVRHQQIKRLLGMEIDKAVCAKHYEKLGCSVEVECDGISQIIPPSWRYDLQIEADLIEEHVRLVGYDQLPEASLSWDYISPEAKAYDVDAIADHLAGEGFSEAITYSFVDPDFLKTWLYVVSPIVLANPMSPKMAALRSSLLPGLLEAAVHNARRQCKQMRLFEVGHCFEAQGDLVVENRSIGMLVFGGRAPEQWGSSHQPSDFFDLKGIFEGFFESQMQQNIAECQFKLASKPLPCFHPAQVVDVFYQDQLIGRLGHLHPRLLRSMGLEGAWLFGEWVKIDNWLQKQPSVFKEYSNFPTIRRDICFFMPFGIECEDVIGYIREQASPLLQKIIVFDDYRDQGEVCGERRSLALGLVFQRQDRSLTDEEVAKIVDTWVEGIKKELNVSVR